MGWCVRVLGGREEERKMKGKQVKRREREKQEDKGEGGCVE